MPKRVRGKTESSWTVHTDTPCVSSATQKQLPQEARTERWWAETMASGCALDRSQSIVHWCLSGCGGVTRHDTMRC